MSEHVYAPPQGPFQGRMPAGLYAAMGRDNIFVMMAAFYEELGRSPIAHLFATSSEGRRRSSAKSAAFFVQVMGGPPLYIQSYGPPQMRARHLPFAIDKAAKEHWLACFHTVLEDAPASYHFPAEHVPAFEEWLAGFAAWMVNVAPTAATS